MGICLSASAARLFLPGLATAIDLLAIVHTPGPSASSVGIWVNGDCVREHHLEWACEPKISEWRVCQLQWMIEDRPCSYDGEDVETRVSGECFDITILVDSRSPWRPR